MSISHDDSKKHFWNKYLATLQQAGIRPDQYQWHVRHCEYFLRQNTATRLSQHTPDTLKQYLTTLVNNNRLKDWQKQQAVEAVSLLFLSIHAPLYKSIDWNYWKSSCKDLPRDHDTHYRTTHPLPDRKSEQVRSSLRADDASITEEVDRLRIAIRRKNMSIRSEKSYADWLARLLRFSHREDFNQLDQRDVVSFLEYLALQRGVSPNTQSSALNAISYYFKNVLGREIGDISHFIRARPRIKLPVVMSRSEVAKMINHLEGMQKLLVSLLYGAGLRIMEATRLRVQDIDFDFQQVIVRDGKGRKERAVPLPVKLVEPFHEQIGTVEKLHQEDLEQGYGSVFMPEGLALKYGKSSKDFLWQYVFPSLKLSCNQGVRTLEKRIDEVNAPLAANPC